eukprot:tig00000076_g2357.t1
MHKSSPLHKVNDENPDARPYFPIKRGDLTRFYEDVVLQAPSIQKRADGNPFPRGENFHRRMDTLTKFDEQIVKQGAPIYDLPDMLKPDYRRKRSDLGKLVYYPHFLRPIY